MLRHVLTGLAGIAFIAPASFAQVFAREVEYEARAETSVEVRAIQGTFSDRDSARDRTPIFPHTDVEAVVDVDEFGLKRWVPYSVSRARTGGKGPGAGSTGFNLSASMMFDLDEADRGLPIRSASGSWSQRLVFRIEKRGQIHINVSPRLFDSIEYTTFEPGRLTGPDGEIVSGRPAGATSWWCWVIDLDPGEYTFDTFASYGFETDIEGRLGDTARHDVSFLLFELPCEADLDRDGELTVFDFLEFQNFFDAGDDRADLDGDGRLTLFDFLAFQDAFDAGCD